jgi:hypothetical protein
LISYYSQAVLGTGKILAKAIFARTEENGRSFSLQALQRASDARAEYEKSMALQPLQTESYFQLGLMDL